MHQHTISPSPSSSFALSTSLFSHIFLTATRGLCKSNLFVDDVSSPILQQATLFEYVKVNGKGQGQAPHTPAQRQDNVGKAAPSMSVQPQQPLPPKPAAPSSYLDAVRGKQQTQERNNNSNNRGWVPQGLSS